MAVAPLTLVAVPDPPKKRWPSRAAPIENFLSRGLQIVDGRWYCTQQGCEHNETPFPTDRSAKSHPFAAHGIKSNFSVTRKRMDRRYRSAPIASEMVTAKIDEFLDGLKQLPEIARRRIRREIMVACGVPLDSPPPLPTVPSIAGQLPLIKFTNGDLFPGEREELRRAGLHLVYTFAMRTKRKPTAVVDAFSLIVERRFWPVGIGLVSTDSNDGYGGKSKAEIQTERLAELLGSRQAR